MKSKSFAASPVTVGTVKRVIESQPSAIALVGQKGAGKLFVAEIIASEVLQEEKLSNYPHYIAINAEKSGIDDVRELQKKLILKVASDKTVDRIAVIEHFDAFGHEAQNALLKTLEEPPEGTMLIMTIDVEDNVLPTIFSRVQKVIIPPVDIVAAREFIGSASEQELQRAFLISGGSAGLLLSLLENNADHELVVAIDKAKRILQAPKFMRLGMVDSLIKDKETPVLKVLDASVRLLETSYTQAIRANKPKTALTQAHKRLKLSLETIEDIQNGVNQKLALTRLFAAL